jgi:hypothetical protein
MAITQQTSHGDNRYSVKAKCPYCGFENNFGDLPACEKLIRYCGGCDEDFVVSVTTVVASAQIYSLVPNTSGTCKLTAA